MNRTRFEQRRASDLVLEFSETTQERLALPLTACLKLLRQTLLDHLGTGPTLQLLPLSSVVGVEVGQDRQRLLQGGREISGIGGGLVRFERSISVSGRTLRHQRSSGPLCSGGPPTHPRPKWVATPHAAQSSGADERAPTAKAVWCAINR